MARKKQRSSNQHLDFIALLRSSMHVPEKKAGPVTIVADNDAENEVNSELMREIQAKFDALFGPLD